MTIRCVRRPAGSAVSFVSFVVLSACLAAGGCKNRHVSNTCDTKPETAATQPRPAIHDTGGQTDNSACMVCHLDLADEPIAAQHLEAGIVCAACHGPSEDHGGDELNIITPDVTFGRSEIVPFCTSCHPTHKTGEDYDAFVKKWYGKRRPNGRMVLDNSVCTDCHGNHAVLSPEQQALE